MLSGHMHNLFMWHSGSSVTFGVELKLVEVEVASKLRQYKDDMMSIWLSWWDAQVWNKFRRKINMATSCPWFSWKLVIKDCKGKGKGGHTPEGA